VAQFFRENSAMIQSVPVNEVRGRIASKHSGFRTGLYYGFSVDSHLGSHAALFHNSYLDMLQMTDETVKALLKEVGQNLSGMRTNSGSGSYSDQDISDEKHVDVLTAAYYPPNENEALAGHEDFGIATLGVADKPGLQYQTQQGWVD